MEHLNYCRKFVKMLQLNIDAPSLSDGQRKAARHLIDLSAASQKFILPDGGLLLQDDELRALSADTFLRLPHPFIALEFRANNGIGKHIIFVREHLDSKSIWLTSCHFIEADGTWAVDYDCALPMDYGLCYGKKTPDGKTELTFLHEEHSPQEIHAGYVSVVLGLLNALQCSNIRIERSYPKKSGHKIKSAIPFDTYHVLTIDVPGRAGDLRGPTGPHRSPREHLRRGHIRRLSDGRRIWINATVVGADRGGGVVTKDYKLRMRAAA